MTLYRALRPARIGTALVLAAVAVGSLAWYSMAKGNLQPSPSAATAGKPVARPAASEPQGAGAKTASGKGGSPVSIEVAKASTRAINDQISTIGTVRATESSKVRPQIAGRISRIDFVEGQRVRKGTVLFELDAQVARAEAEQVNAQLQLARANLARTRELATQGFVSPAAGDTAAANVQVLEASLSLARARLEQHLVRAPFDGQVGLRNVSPGEFVKDGTDLVSFEDTASIKIEFRLPERYFGYVRTGQPIEFEVDALPGRKFAADIYIIDSEMDRDGRALLARAQAKNPGRTLASGMFARVRVSLAHRPAAVVIPEECIVPGAAGQVVFKVREVGGRTVTARVPVTVGQRSEGMVEILSGVDAGDLVVTAGQMRLQGDGQNVRIVDRSARARPTAPSAAPAAGSR